MKKLLGILLLSIIALVIPALSVSAQSFEIIDVDVEGMSVAEGDIIYVERGDNLNIRVEIKANVSTEDLKVKAWIGGYEYDDIEDISDMFDLDAGVKAAKYLNLEIPEDIDSNDEYTLKIEAYNKYEENEWFEITLKIEAQRHNLDIQDVIFSPGLSLDANTPLFVQVRLENLGDKKEEDIRVEVSIPALGITQVDYIDELVAYEDDDDEETSESTDSLYLDLSNAQPGTYTLNVNVEYNNGHSEILESYDLTIT
ncbi:MAG: hypothetical protein ISS82_02705, partial [Nanoarchaeota archaeon]|nr:hypothetical protein [Nanoarchaeota archaeon]